MIHSVTIKRPGHAIVDQQKVMSEPTIKTGQTCRFESAGDSPTAAMLGIGAHHAWRAFFPAGTDLEIGDVLVPDGEPGVTTVVRGIDKRYAGPPQAHHLEVTLATREV